MFDYNACIGASPNFWSYLVCAQTQMLVDAVKLLPIGAANPLLTSAPAILYFAWAPILIFVGSFINLGLWALAIGIVLILEGVRLVLALTAWVAKVAGPLLKLFAAAA